MKPASPRVAVDHRDARATLEDRGIFKKPRMLSFHGPLLLEMGDRSVDFGPLNGPSMISEMSLSAADCVRTTARRCLTVENEEVFLELAKRNDGWLLIHTSFPGSAVRRLFERIGPEVECYHFGDSDPAGFDILRDLREKTGRDFRPVRMEFRPDVAAPRLTVDERRTVDRLLGSPMMADVHPELLAMRDADSKGRFEQESVPLKDVWEIMA